MIYFIMRGVMGMTQISVARAKQHLGELLGRVAYGREEVLITKRGKPMAVLVPPGPRGRPRHLADARGWLPNDDPFFDVMANVVRDRLRHRPRRPTAIR